MSLEHQLIMFSLYFWWSNITSLSSFHPTAAGYRGICEILNMDKVWYSWHLFLKVTRGGNDVHWYCKLESSVFRLHSSVTNIISDNSQIFQPLNENEKSTGWVVHNKVIT